MKRNNINRILKIGLLSLFVAFMGSSCVKSVDGRTDFSNLQATALISDGGLQNFKGSALLFPPTDNADTTYFHVEYAATNVAPQVETMTLAVDPDALAAYNATGGAQFEAMPDSVFSFTTTTVTVPKGANYSSLIPLIIYPSKLNLLKNYMLPISIKVAPAGTTTSSNYKTIFYHTIGNPIAGLYNWDWTRYNNQTGTPPPTGSSFVGHQTIIAPQDATTATVPSGYFIQPSYVISFTNTAGVLSNFAVSFSAADIAALSAGGVTVTSGPNILFIDPVKGIYQFQYAVFNGSSYRYLIDKYYK